MRAPRLDLQLSVRPARFQHGPGGLKVCVMAIMPCLGLLGLLAELVGLPAQVEHAPVGLDPSLIVTPARLADHSTSSELSHASGSASVRLASAALRCRSPTCAKALRRKSVTEDEPVAMDRLSRPPPTRSPGESPVVQVLLVPTPWLGS
jgi:hypothetical protein